MKTCHICKKEFDDVQEGSTYKRIPVCDMCIMEVGSYKRFPDGVKVSVKEDGKWIDLNDARRKEMITEITGSTTVDEICKVIKYIARQEGEGVWVEIYSDISGGFYAHKNGENIEIIDLDEIELYIKDYSEKTDLEDIIYAALETEEGRETIFKAIMDVLR
jgi:hypothetical protein